MPCAPILVDLVVDGKAIKAVGQPTKQGWIYVFDRVTGQPVWPIEERPVEKGDVPGEWYSPTQPFVTKPPPFERQGVTVDDLIDFTPELRAEAIKVASRYKIGPLFTPPVVSKWPGPLGILMLPNITGGANWQGGSFDPETKMFYIFSNTSISSLGLVPGNPERNKDFAYVQGTARNPDAPPPAEGGRGAAPGGGRGEAPRPARRRSRRARRAAGGRRGAGRPRRRWWRRRRRRRRAERSGAAADQAALRADHGDRSEQGRAGVADRARRDARQHQESSGAQGPEHPAHRTSGPHRRADDQDAGDCRRGRVRHDAERQRGAMLRAYDKATGKEVGAVYMPAPQTGSPMTYMVNGRQYITVSISGPGYSGSC